VVHTCASVRDRRKRLLRKIFDAFRKEREREKQALFLELQAWLMPNVLFDVAVSGSGLHRASGCPESHHWAVAGLVPNRGHDLSLSAFAESRARAMELVIAREFGEKSSMP
jgi:hypothetical protein